MYYITSKKTKNKKKHIKLKKKEKKNMVEVSYIENPKLSLGVLALNMENLRVKYLGMGQKKSMNLGQVWHSGITLKKNSF